MQRSRRAFLQRRALEKAIGRDNLYTFSLRLVFVLWGLVFLLNSWISVGDGDREESSALVAFNVSSWDGGKLGSDAALNSIEQNLIFPEDHISGTYSESSCGGGAKVEESTGELESGNFTKNDTSTVVPGTGEHAAVESSNSDAGHRKEGGKADRLIRTVPLGLDEFKSKALSSKSTYVSGAKGGVIHRMEPGGGKYNYASAAKGAKVLDSNKEAKGASNILNKDKDKYLRSPCSAEDKFVVIELSEETLVDTIEIANFEHYSSNLKEFELLGSLVYPTQTWVKLGNFSAGNVKHAQTFTLSEPEWVRYLKLKILSHYGSEFYCTLSSIEVYGVDAVERMLEDLIAVPDNHHSVGEQESAPAPSVSESSEHSGHGQDVSTESESTGSPNLNNESATSTVTDPVEEVRHQAVSRMPGDTVLKILMQKVRALDLSLSVLERYLEDVNSKYAIIFKDFDEELEEKEALLENARSDIKNVLDSKDLIAKEVVNLMAWKSEVSMQLNDLLEDNAILRSDVRRVRENQLHMESRGIVVFLTSLIFGFLALVMLFRDMVNSAYSPKESRKFCSIKSSWFSLFLCCTTIIIILSL